MSDDTPAPAHETQHHAEMLVAELLELLELEHWVVTVAVQESVIDAKNPDCDAFIEFTDGYDQADITVNLFNIRGPEHLDESVAHEIGHVHLRELDRLAHYAVPRRMRPHVAQAVDRAIVRFARALTKLRR